ncbi:transcriptional regulator [Candidatus Poribacteria bacterium]|nr:transcriptional regulator [Candidatus Poribacteria bacterium]MDP6597199.1 zinc ribbon domain-containing protein [Candidatus Poribacteria bacterium]MDP6747673.1 zinc ribbon domain-containing protein [Candidatus Poribacteria bacterium]MDP6995730.1 zinc ribbon domain-containing protein [Candidatus Poribacteria bacterium]
MPLYEYQCRQCGDQFEILQRMSVTAEEIAGLECPQCGTSNPKKTLSVFSGQTSSPSLNMAADCGIPSG